MSDVIHVDGSASTPCRVHDVIIVEESSSSTSSNTRRPVTTVEIVEIVKHVVVTVGVDGVVNRAAMLNDELATDVQVLAFAVVTV